MINNNLIPLVITFVLMLVWLRLNDYTAHKGWVSGHISRKIIHTGTGPLFLLCWLLFDDDPINRYLAALVPFAITVQFAFVGLGIIKDQAAVDAMSRTGDRKEILRGPLFYGIVFVIMTIVYWKYSPIGVIALMLMCGGDGLADIFGRKYGLQTLPWSDRKTWVGSLAMFLGGFTFAAIIVLIYLWAGIFSGSAVQYLINILVIAFVGSAVESLPFRDIDNISVTLAAVLVGHLLF